MAKLKAARPKLATARSRLRSPAKRADAHYHSSAHTAWAELVKQRAGYQCERCKAKGKGVRLHADHKREIKDGGAEFDLKNGQCLCQACHNKKSGLAKARRNGR